ncbi:MAG: HAD family hydrolase [Acidobacteria bacterium]|nr:HAD family hydrolase [Acidobacteriota bacterium]
MRPAVFLDRDGTLIDENGYVNHIGRVRHLPRSAEAVKRLRGAGFMAVLVTNQSGVARRLFDRALVDQVHEQLQERMQAEGTRLDAFYVCPHHPDGADPEYRRVCDCRKPKPGMILTAARELGLDLARSYMVGDTLSDVEAAHRAGVTSVLVLTGYGRGEAQYRMSWKGVRPAHVAEDLLDAAEWILGRSG